jgi:putative ABC transport system permease protein
MDVGPEARLNRNKRPRRGVYTMEMSIWLESVLQDLRYAWRSFHRTAGSMWIAVAAMALGIGGTAAVFSVVDRLLFRPLPYVHQDRLVWFGMKAPISNNEFLLESAFYTFREHQLVLESMTSMSRVGDCDLNQQNPLRLVCAQVAANFLPVFGLKPHIGRNIAPEEDVPNGPRTALLAYGFWERQYGGDAGVLGRTIIVDGRAAQVVGVLPPEFELPTLTRVDLLLPQQANISPRVDFTFLTVFGRLKPGISVERARAALYPLYQEALKTVPAGFAKDITFHVTGLRERQVRDYRTASMVLLACVLGVLLIAYANVANLLLARAAMRRRELVVRAAIGASRSRLIRQMMTESLLLSAAGCVSGLLLAAGLLSVLLLLAPEGIPRLQEASLDTRVLLFAIGASVFCGFLFGIAPALQTPRAEMLNTARVAGGGMRLRQMLVALQIGLSFVLLSGAGLLLQSLSNMQRVQLGMNPERVLTARVQLGQERYPRGPQQAQFIEQASERLSRLPGLRSFAWSDSVPLYGSSTIMIYNNIEVEGHPPPDPRRSTGGVTVFRTVSPGYFETMGIPIVRGRGFTESDRSSAEEVVILDEALARKLFPGEDPIGRRMRSGQVGVGAWRTIIGITRNVKNAGLTGRDDPEYYHVWRKGPDSGRRRAHLLFRSEADPASLSGLIRSEVAQIDPTLPLTITTMEHNLGTHIQRPRFESFLLSLFAGIGVLLAAVGQFGVISYLVTQRSSEIGVRMALGATARDVVTLVTRQTLVWTLLGAIAGLIVAWFASRQFESLLFGVGARDLLNLSAVFALLIGVSLAAAWHPMRRAARMDPAQVLRHE